MRSVRGWSRPAALAVLAALVLAGIAWYVHERGAGAPARPTPPSPASAPGTVGGADAVPPPAVATASGPATGATGVMTGSASAPGPSGGPPTGIEVAQLGLTRQLAGEHLVNIDGRRQRVLGSKSTTDAAGRAETMLVIRDELSGQLSYRRSGLQFTLAPGTDYEAFIAAHRSMQRVFVNPLYAQVMIDAAEIAAQFNALSQDPRVVKLRFMTRDPVAVPK